MIQNPHDLGVRMRAVAYAFENPHSALYRNLYGAYTLPQFPTEEDWGQIPLLTKEALGAVPFHARLFSPLNDVHYIRASSGTSGKNLLVVPKTRVHPKSMIAPEGDVRGGTLTFLQPQHQMEIDYRAYGINVPVISGDPANLEACTRLAAEVGVDVLRTYPFIMERHLPFLLGSGLAEKLKVIIMTGERLLIEDIRRYAAVFPSATMMLYYAATEAQGCPGVAVVSPHDTEILYVPCEDYYWELVDEEGTVITDDGVEGEVIFTMLWTAHNNLPLIRYATGDIGVRKRAVDGTERYVILGRKHTDRIKVPKGELRVEEVERALKTLLGEVVPFELHYHKRPEGTQKPQTIIKIATTLPETPDLLAKRLEVEIRISTADVYGTLVTEGLHAPLKVEGVTAFPPENGKKKRFHVHEAD